MVFPNNYAGLSELTLSNSINRAILTAINLYIEWSCRFRIFNEAEQPFPPQNHATSHPNLLFADNKNVGDIDAGKFALLVE